MTELASQTVANELRRMIISGELASGSLVSEAHLRELLGCGRTPLREALQQLSHHYLVRIEPRRGTLIPQLSIVDYQQLSEAQLLMRVELSGLAAERIDGRQLEELKGTVRQQEQCDEQRDYYGLVELDGQFHSQIAEASGNRYCTDIDSRLHSALASFLYRGYQAAGGAGVSTSEHWRIVEALEAKDAELAKLEARKHVTQASQRVLDNLGLAGRRNEQQ